METIASYCLSRVKINNKFLSIQKILQIEWIKTRVERKQRPLATLATHARSIILCPALEYGDLSAAGRGAAYVIVQPAFCGGNCHLIPANSPPSSTYM